MGKKILLIEDSAFERKAVITVLKKAGYTDFVEAEDGETGLEKVESEKPDLILLDLRLPGIEGLDVLEKVKKSNPDIKVIIVSIVARQESIDKAVKLGANAYVMKPVTEEKLIPEIQRILK